MEFWGVEVKCGEPLLVEPGEGMVLHLSQANLGEAKKDKGGESVYIHVTLDGKKLVLATLNTDKLPQQQFDLIFDRDFEISHNWKNGSVFFYGYLATNPVDEDEDSDEFHSDEEDIPLHTSNGKPDTKSKPEKPAVAEKANAAKDSASGKQKVKIAEPKKGAKDEDDSVSSDEDEDMDDEEDSETGEGDDGSDSGDDDSEEESEETPKKVESGKKRPSESSKKTPVPEKKVKMATQKTDGKKSGSEHVATPHPSKKAGKTPSGNKENQKTPKSGGSHLCKSCNRSFGSENALDSHSKAKHSAGK